MSSPVGCHEVDVLDERNVLLIREAVAARNSASSLTCFSSSVVTASIGRRQALGVLGR